MSKKNNITIDNRVIIYLLLIAVTVVAALLMMFLSVIASGSRTTGVGWGISLGIITGHFLLCLFLRYKLIAAIVKTVCYGGLLYGLFYLIANYFPQSLPGHKTFSIILYACSVILSWELSLWITKKITPTWV